MIQIVTQHGLSANQPPYDKRLGFEHIYEHPAMFVQTTERMSRKYNHDMQDKSSEIRLKRHQDIPNAKERSITIAGPGPCHGIETYAPSDKNKGTRHSKNASKPDTTDHDAG